MASGGIVKSAMRQTGRLAVAAVGRPGHRSMLTHTQVAAAVATHSQASGAASSQAPDVLTITQPDDWHLHVRDGDMMAAVLPHTAATFGRAIIMPNLQPPVTEVDQAIQYKQRIRNVLTAAAADARGGSELRQGAAAALEAFQPLMTLYLTDKTSPSQVKQALAAGVAAYKLYPAGATTNSDSGVTDVTLVTDTLKAMADEGMPLCVHGEVTDPAVDIFDREREFIDRVLEPLLQRIPDLRVIMEHITTADAVDYVRSRPDKTAASITPQHMLLSRNELFKGGLRPHVWCLPVLKRERHRQAVAEAATSGDACFFLGTDSAPHARTAKESSCGCAGIYSAPAALPLYAEAFEAAGALHRLEGFASHNGPDFYRMPRNAGTVTLRRKQWKVPETQGEGALQLVPMYAGTTLQWQVDERYQ